MAEEDRRDLQTFIDELQRLLQDVASETRHPHLLSPDRREDLRTALGAFSNFFGDVRHALDDPVVDIQPTTPGKYSLENAQLTGEPRRRKIGGIRRALDRSGIGRRARVSRVSFAGPTCFWKAWRRWSPEPPRSKNSSSTRRI